MKNGSPKTDPSNFSRGSPNDKEKDDKDLNSQSRHDIPIYYSNYIHSSIISIYANYFFKTIPSLLELLESGTIFPENPTFGDRPSVYD